MGNSSPLVYVVIPNKNGRFHFSYSLKSLANSTYNNYKVVLVDNGSSDDSLSYVRDNYSDITVLANKGKPGFAGGVNTGIKYALEHGAEYIAIFSNDIQVLPTWIELVLEVFEKESHAGLVGFKEIAKENEAEFFSSVVSGDTVQHWDVKGAAGCLYLCSSELFRTIGFLDEDYYMYGEDNDLFSRILKSGFKIIETSVPVWHFGEGFSRGNKFMPTWLAYRNALRFSIKNESPLRVARMFLSLFNQGCNPLFKARKHDPSSMRLRRYNPLVNFMLIIGSCMWNIAHIGFTLKARQQQKKCVKF